MHFKPPFFCKLLVKVIASCYNLKTSKTIVPANGANSLAGEPSYPVLGFSIYNTDEKYVLRIDYYTDDTFIVK